MWNLVVLRKMLAAKKAGDWTMFYYWQEMFDV